MSPHKDTQPPSALTINAGCNEFHYLASNINCDGALDIARLLLAKGTSLMEKERKYGNSAFFTLCQ